MVEHAIAEPSGSGKSSRAVRLLQMAGFLTSDGCGRAWGGWLARAERKGHVCPAAEARDVRGKGSVNEWDGG